MNIDVKSGLIALRSSINWWPHLVFFLILSLVYIEFNVNVLISFSQIFLVIVALMIFINTSVTHQYFKEYIFLYDLATVMVICAGFNLANVLYHFQVFSYSYTGIDVRFIEVLSFLVIYCFFEKMSRFCVLLAFFIVSAPVIIFLVLNEWLWHYQVLGITVSINLILNTLLIALLFQRKVPIELRSTIYFILGYFILMLSLVFMLIAPQNLVVYFLGNVSDWFILSGFIHNSLQLELNKVGQVQFLL